MKMAYDNENERSRFLQGQVQWARGILANPNIKYQSGKMSHDCALDILEQSQDELIDHLVFIP